MAFSGIGCITVPGVTVSAIDEDAVTVTDAQVDAAIERLSEEEAAKIMQEIIAADGLLFPRPFDKATDTRHAEAAACSAFAGTSCVSGVEVDLSDGDGVGDGEDDGDGVMGTMGFAERGGSINSSAASSCRTTDAGVDRRCFQPSSAVLPNSSPPPVDDTPPTGTPDVPPTCPASLGSTSPMAAPPPPSPPLSPPPPAPQRLDLSETEYNDIDTQRLKYRFVDLLSTAATNRITPSSSPPSPSPPSPSPPSPSPPPPPPPLAVQQPPMQLPQPGALHVSAGSNDAPSLPPSPPPVVQRLAIPPSPAQALQVPLPPPSPSSPAFHAPQLPTSSRSSFNPLAGMFSPGLDTHSLASSLGDVLYRGGVLPVLATSRRSLKAVGRGEATSAMMEAIIRGMQSSHGRTNIARDNGGATFVGPKTRTPTYKTGKGLSRLLNEISRRHEVGTQFVVCLDAPHPGAKAHVITGVVSKIETPLQVETGVSSAWGLPLPLSSAEALIHGGGGEITVENWAGVNGDIEEGRRLSAWVY